MRGGFLALALVACGLASPAVAAAQSAAYTHDSNGNLTSRVEAGVEWSYVWDSRDMLREVRRDGVLFEAYQYDAEGRRIRKTSAEGIVRYVWDGNRIVAETDDFGNRIARYEYVGDRILSVDHVTQGVAFYLLDTLGSPVGLVRADGSLAALYRLDAWGVLRAEDSSLPNPFRFTGHQFDEATGLYYAKARYYEPATARFQSEDPLKGAPAYPPSLHAYQYAYANPTVFVDPDGRCAGSLQQTDFCQAIARGMAYVLEGDPEARVEREIERRERVMQGRREFRAQTGRDPMPDEVVWSDGGRALTSGFKEIDMTGRVEAAQTEWALIGGGIGARVAVSSARAAGASAGEQVFAGLTQLADEAIGEVAGVSPSDAATLARMARQGLSPRPPPAALDSPQAMIVGESAATPGVELLSFGGPNPARIAEPPAASRRSHPPSSGVSVEQPRDALGRFLAKNRPEQRAPGVSAVDDFISRARDGGFEIIGREVSVETPFGLRRYDVVIRDSQSGLTHGIEVKSSQEAFDRFDQPARQQFAADRWVNRMGANAVGKHQGLVVDDATKILWRVP